MYLVEIHFRNCYLNGFGIFNPLTFTFDPVTTKSTGFLFYSGQMCGPSFISAQAQTSTK